jgi:PAS domain-containing protein
VAPGVSNSPSSERHSNLGPRLEVLREIFAGAVIGDFSKNITMPSTDDEFGEVMSGVQVMLEVIREKIADYEKLSKSLEDLVRQKTTELQEAQRSARLGNWSWNLTIDQVQLSDIAKEIYNVTQGKEVDKLQDWLAYISEDDRGELEQALQNAVRTGRPFEMDVQATDDTSAWIHIKASAQLSPQGHVTKLFGTAQDVTERKTFEDELRKRADDLEIMNKAMVGRELRLIELKKEVERLQDELHTAKTA